MPRTAAPPGRARPSPDLDLEGLPRPPPPAFAGPGPDDPLRLLLSSWTYPEPRTDLAMRE
jgi:hypothetical protein